MLGSCEQMLTVLEVTAHLATDHHGELVNSQLGRGAVVPPIVVVCTTDGVHVVWMLIFDVVNTDLVLHCFP